MAAKRASRDGKAEGRLRTATEVKVERIAGMMRRLEWVRGETGKELAREWKVGLKWVEELAAIASKRVRAELLEDKDHVGATVGASLSWGIQEAVRTGDLSALARLAKIYADAAGVSAAQKIETTVGASLDDIDVARQAAMQNEEGDDEPEVAPEPAAKIRATRARKPTKAACTKPSPKRKASAPSS